MTRMFTVNAELQAAESSVDDDVAAMFIQMALDAFQGGQEQEEGEAETRCLQNTNLSISLTCISTQHYH